MPYPILSQRNVNSNIFIDFWATQYVNVREHYYAQNIDLLTPKAVRKLYFWKNGGKLSGRKKRSVEDNFVARLKQLKGLPCDYDIHSFLKLFSKGGTIWRIFFLHIWQPQKHPIYDQHVYRAMSFIKTATPEEIPNKETGIIDSYIEEYITFHDSFPQSGNRIVDKALWSFGRFLKSQFKTMI